MKLNPLLVAISSAMISLSCATVQAAPVQKVDSISINAKKPALNSLRIAAETTSSSTNFANPREYQRSVSRLKQYGITKETRPYLFSLMEQQSLQSKSQIGTLSTKNSSTKNLSLNVATASNDPTDCNTSPDEICSFFINTGFSLLPNPNKPEDVYLVASALNSERLPTNYTLVDLALMNEKFEYITTPNFVEYYGDGGASQKRKAIETYALANQLMRDKVAASERLIADAWITVVKIVDGKEVLEEHNIMLDYSKDSLLELLDEYLSAPAMVMAKSSVHALMTDPVPAPRSSGIPTNPNKLELVSPIDHRSAEGEGIKDGKIIICLNRNYGDCDYDNIYPPNTPNDQVLLKIPFEGSLTIPGEVTKIYKSTDTLPFNAHYPTDIFVQMKEIGGGFSINDSNFTNLKDLFANSITRTYFDVSGNPVDRTVDTTTRVTKTKIEWNLPRDTTSFGEAKHFGRYEDAQWIQHIVADVKTHPARPATSQVFVVGSDDPYSIFPFPQPPMQFVYSCLAEGSMITLANGEKRTIESLTTDDVVMGASEYNPDLVFPLSIEDISIGFETIPMVEVTTQSGRTLLLTESHPVITTSDQPVWAKHLNQGDRIQTLEDNGDVGSDMITKIKMVDYDKQVYNLKLGRTADDDQISDRDESFVMIANNMMVGDLGMQSENEFKSVNESTEDVLNRIPSQWHQDYLNSQN